MLIFPFIISILRVCLGTPNIRYQFCRAKRGGSGALYSQSALARLNSFLRLVSCRVCLKQVVLTSGSCAMGIHELCQVRKEAALSGHPHVPQGYLDRANYLSNAYGCQSKKGARQLSFIHTKLILSG